MDGVGGRRRRRRRAAMAMADTSAKADAKANQVSNNCVSLSLGARAAT